MPVSKNPSSTKCKELKATFPAMMQSITIHEVPKDAYDTISDDDGRGSEGVNYLHRPCSHREHVAHSD